MRFMYLWQAPRWPALTWDAVALTAPVAQAPVTPSPRCLTTTAAVRPETAALGGVTGVRPRAVAS